MSLPYNNDDNLGKNRHLRLCPKSSNMAMFISHTARGKKKTKVNTALEQWIKDVQDTTEER